MHHLNCTCNSNNSRSIKIKPLHKKTLALLIQLPSSTEIILFRVQLLIAAFSLLSKYSIEDFSVSMPLYFTIQSLIIK
jgi:hypothetical protein